MANILALIQTVVPVPLLGPIINIVELISTGILGMRANQFAFRAFGERLCLFVVTLNEHAKIKSSDGDVPAVIKDNISAIQKLMEQIEDYVDRHTRMNVIRQFLKHSDITRRLELFDQQLVSYTQNLQLRIQFDQHQMVAEIKNDQMNTLQALEKMQINEQLLETLVDIDRLDIDDFSPELRPQVQNLLKNARNHISNRSTRGLKSSKDWTVENFEVEIDYRNPIGQGGFGVIYKGRWKGQTVAVKVVSSSHRTDASDLIEKEAAIWYNLNDPNIVKLWRVCVNADNPFIVMPLMRCDAAAYIRDNPQTEMAVRTYIILQIASGMKYLHDLSHPIIHGDLKANNVLIGMNGEVALSDFGMASLKQFCYSKNHHEPQTFATRWIAPEKYNADYTSATPADVFSFAMTCVEILSGQAPFPDEKYDDVVKDAIISGSRPKQPPGVSDALWQIVTSCWHHDPEQRPTFGHVMSRLTREHTKRLPPFNADSFQSLSHIYPELHENHFPPSFVSNSTQALPLRSSYNRDDRGSFTVGSFAPSAQPPSYNSHNSSAILRHNSKVDRTDYPTRTAGSTGYTGPIDLAQGVGLQLNLNNSQASELVYGQTIYNASSSSFANPTQQQRQQSSYSSFQNIQTIGTPNGLTQSAYKMSVSPQPIEYNTVTSSVHQSTSPRPLANFPSSPKSGYLEPYANIGGSVPNSFVAPYTNSSPSLHHSASARGSDIDLLLRLFPSWAQSHGITVSNFQNIVDTVNEDNVKQPILRAGYDGRIHELRILNMPIRNPLPSEIVLFANLGHLWIERCCLNGHIPSTIGNLTSITRLDLTNNELSGSIPESIGNLHQLKHLDLSCNKLSGSITPSLFNLVQLEFLNLSTNSLSGVIPNEIGQLWRLKGVDLEGNKFNGRIPSGLGNLKQLQTLDLSNNEFSGDVSPELSNMQSLTQVNMDWHLLSSIPTFIYQLRAMN
ncbi:hypothetical protein BDV3_002027 [Batrachochytrium dendrobatidis]